MAAITAGILDKSIKNRCKKTVEEMRMTSKPDCSNMPSIEF